MILSLHTDRLEPKAESSLADCPRIIYVREGDAIVRAGAQAAGLGPNSAWHGSSAAAVVAGSSGATLWRWELGTRSTGSPALTHSVELDDPGGYLMRCDRVDFPPGAVAWTHVHRGPGIRCLLAGSIRVEVNGKAHDVEPGGAWFEAGPDPVLATASRTAPTAFVRVMILPRELRGKSSIRYVRPEDAEKPRLQTYRVFVDDFIDLDIPAKAGI